MCVTRSISFFFSSSKNAPSSLSVFNLTEGIDVPETEAKLTAYAAANAASIAAHAAAAVEAVRAVDAAAAAAPPEDDAQPAAAPSAYAPTAAAAPTAALPVPTALPPPPPSGPMSDDARRAMGAASGWDSQAARKAGILDAIRTLFAF